MNRTIWKKSTAILSNFLFVILVVHKKRSWFFFSELPTELCMLLTTSNFTNKICLRWPEPIYMLVGYVFDLRFSEWKIQPISMIFGILSINNNGTLRKCYLFSCRYKNLWDIGMYLKPHFYEKWENLWNPTTDFSLTSANKPLSSLVLQLQVWRQSWP